MYSFGWGELGQLGIKSLYGVQTANFQINKVPLADKVCKIGAGAISSYAVTTKTKSMFVWGSNQNG